MQSSNTISLSCRLWFVKGCVAVLALGSFYAFAQPANDLLPLDSGAQGYKIDNKELPIKERLRLPGNISLREFGWIDEDRVVANLIADKAGNYWTDPVKKVVIVNTRTGQVEQTPYGGNVKCFSNGNIALSYRTAQTIPESPLHFEIGKFGGTLESFIESSPPFVNGVPKGMVLNEWSCELMPYASVPQKTPDGQQFDWRIRLRKDHGFLHIKRGVPLREGTEDFSPALKNLMNQPFMRNMGAVSPMEEWHFITPEGKDTIIPTNPGEAVGEFAKIEYLPYKNAYFLAPYVRGRRPYDPPELVPVPTFARLLYGDGRVERIGVPDVIAAPYLNRELLFHTYYTKRGVVWEIAALDPKSYSGELQMGYYLDDRETKTLRRLPPIIKGNVARPSPLDGCSFLTRTEYPQTRPYTLLNEYYVNICKQD